MQLKQFEMKLEQGSQRLVLVLTPKVEAQTTHAVGELQRRQFVIREEQKTQVPEYGTKELSRQSRQKLVELQVRQLWRIVLQAIH